MIVKTADDDDVSREGSVEQETSSKKKKKKQKEKEKENVKKPKAQVRDFINYIG